MEDLLYVKAPGSIVQIQQRTATLNFDMASEPLTGALLRTLAASKPGGRLLELGTGTGLATAWLLDGMDAASTLLTVDNDALVQSVAREALGEDPRLQIITQDATEFLRSYAPRSFDLIFADALPGKYEGHELALELVRPGGYYIIDDMLPQPDWPEGHAEKIPILMEQLTKAADFRLVPMAWASGLVLAVKR